jgi:hypothetical protein
MGDALPMRQAAAPSSERIHRPFLVASLCFATLFGFVLGIHVSVSRLLDIGNPDRTSDLIQAHGQVQLLGFAGLFIAGVSLRLMPRFAGARIAFPALLPLILWPIVTGLLLRALVLPWLSGDVFDAMLLAANVSVLLAAGCFLLVVCGTLMGDARRFEASSLAFFFGALQLFAVAVIATFSTIDVVKDGSDRIPFLADNALLHMTLFGFVVSFILGVALRAIPVMIGVERPGRSAYWLAVLLFVASAALGGSLLYLQYVDYVKTVVLASDVAFVALGLVVLSLMWQAGALRHMSNRLRPASQPHLWLIRSAFVWMAFAGLELCYFGVSALIDGQLPGDFHFDAVRHTLGAGVITMLICGMALMILPEFAADRLAANRQRALGLFMAVLINLATLLRVLPALAGTHWSFDDRNLSMAIAGSLAETALLVFAAYYFRLLWRGREHGGNRLG